MPTTPYLYRHDSVQPGRPVGMVDVDADGWLWWCGIGNRLMAHNLATAELRGCNVPEMAGHFGFSVFCWRDRLV